MMSSLKVICWSCKGAMGLDKINRIQLLAKEHNPMIICLIEIRAYFDRIDRFCSRFARHWNWAAITVEGYYSGGIITLWQDRLGCVTPIIKSKFILHMVISNLTLTNMVISVVYNILKIQIQRKVWKELSKLNSLETPWCLIGDFNYL